MFDDQAPHHHAAAGAPTRPMPVWPPPERPMPERPAPGRRLLAEQPMEDARPWPISQETTSSLVLGGPPGRAGLTVLVAAVFATLLVGAAWLVLSGSGGEVEAGQAELAAGPAGPDASLPDPGSTVPAAALPLTGDGSTTLPTTPTSSTVVSTVPTTAGTVASTAAQTMPTTAPVPTTAASTTGSSTTVASTDPSVTPSSGTSSSSTTAPGGSSSTTMASGSSSTSMAPATSTTVAQAPAPVSVDKGALRQSILDLTNAERAKAGCGPLKLDATLTAVADAHSADMAARGFFSHTNPDGLGPGDRVAASGYPFRAWAENIAAGQSTAAEVMNGWMNSAGHRANILNCGLEELGVGYAEGPAIDRVPGRFWTQVFGTRP